MLEHRAINFGRDECMSQIQGRLSKSANEETNVLHLYFLTAGANIVGHGWISADDKSDSLLTVSPYFL
jgi:hypothetical protein